MATDIIVLVFYIIATEDDAELEFDAWIIIIDFAELVFLFYHHTK